MSASPAPGWYPDPSGVTRYWTGSEWGPAMPPGQPTAGPLSPTRDGSVGRMGSDFIDRSRPLPERNLADIAVKPGAGNVVGGIIGVVCGFPVYVAAFFIGALVGGEAGIWIALLFAVVICFALGWGITQNKREERAARDAQIRMGRHLADRERR